jgi:hypothetical protein
MTDRTRLSLTAEEREVLARCVGGWLGVVQIAVATGARGKPLPDAVCGSCKGTGREPGSTASCHPCRGRGHNGNTALARKVEVARRLLGRLERDG